MKGLLNQFDKCRHKIVNNKAKQTNKDLPVGTKETRNGFCATGTSFFVEAVELTWRLKEAF